MKGMADMTLLLKRLACRFARPASFVIAAGVLAIGQALPQVQIDAAGLSPRPIEELTQTTIAHDYALAWSDMASALESSRTDRLSEEFVGFAKDRLMQRIGEQKQTGVHVRIVDHGHHLKAVFYSADGTAMQLIDQVELEIQTYDGSRLLSTQSVPHEYVVLMTPGADRWYVRDLEEISPKTL